MTRTSPGNAEAIAYSNKNFQRTMLSLHTETNATDNAGKKRSLIKKTKLIFGCESVAILFVSSFSHAHGNTVK